ncbi:MAG TPA: putative zinc-binding metallopeptidase [Tepidisphaeraceae bacterium]
MAKVFPAELDTLSDQQLLDLRFRDLRLRIEGTFVEDRIDRLYGELDARGISFKPYFWLSSEWFSPDGHPGIAIPFYLAHPRLARLEKRQMLEVEGWGERQCMRILRHETGHTLENAYRLHYRRKWQELFGSAAAPYPKYYQPKPFSRSYVQHLDMWYAQSHPSEDFAETFAVWLNPSSRWRTRYRDWPAMKKLEYVDELMAEIQGQRPAITSRKQIDPLNRLSQTLREHYELRRAHYQKWPDFYDNDLRRLFSSDPKFKRRPSAAKFLRQIKPELRRLVARWTGEYQYTIDKVLDDIIKRCRELRLRLTNPRELTTLESIVMVTVQTMNYLHGGHHRVAL